VRYQEELIARAESANPIIPALTSARTIDALAESNERIGRHDVAEQLYRRLLAEPLL